MIARLAINVSIRTAIAHLLPFFVSVLYTLRETKLEASAAIRKTKMSIKSKSSPIVYNFLLLPICICVVGVCIKNG
jgi:hypothetical protein